MLGKHVDICRQIQLLLPLRYRMKVYIELARAEDGYMEQFWETKTNNNQFQIGQERKRNPRGRTNDLRCVV